MKRRRTDAMRRLDDLLDQFKKNFDDGLKWHLDRVMEVFA